MSGRPRSRARGWRCHSGRAAAPAQADGFGAAARRIIAEAAEESRPALLAELDELIALQDQILTRWAAAEALP